MYFSYFLVSTYFIGLEISWVIEKESQEIKDFLKTVQANITVTSNFKVKTAVTISSQRIIKCKDHLTLEGFNEAVNNLSFAYGSNIRDGLEAGLHSLMNDGCGEENIQKIIILILYGYRDNVGIGKERGLIEASKAIQEAGIKVFTITIGGLQFNNKQLINIASSTDDIKILVPGW